MRTWPPIWCVRAEQIGVVALQPAEALPEGAGLGVDVEARARAVGVPVEAQKSLRDAPLVIDERLRPVGVERAHERDFAGEVLVADGQVELGPVLLLQARVGEAGAEVVVVDEPGGADVVAASPGIVDPRRSIERRKGARK